jgi:hypothetical protein
MEFLPACVTLLAISIMMMAFMGSMALLEKKTQISQVTRKVMLEMETTGYLSGAEKTIFMGDLAALGLTQIDLGGSTVSEVGYGNPITLSVKGMVLGRDLHLDGGVLGALWEEQEYVLQEKLVSTAKN